MGWKVRTTVTVRVVVASVLVVDVAVTTAVMRSSPVMVAGTVTVMSAGVCVAVTVLFWDVSMGGFFLSGGFGGG